MADLGENVQVSKSETISKTRNPAAFQDSSFETPQIKPDKLSVYRISEAGGF
jgi:hypothetical protein